MTFYNRPLYCGKTLNIGIKIWGNYTLLSYIFVYLMTLISDFVEQNHDVSLLSVDLFEWLCTKRQLFLKSQNWKGFALVRYQNGKPATDLALISHTYDKYGKKGFLNVMHTRHHSVFKILSNLLKNSILGSYDLRTPKHVKLDFWRVRRRKIEVLTCNYSVS